MANMFRFCYCTVQVGLLIKCSSIICIWASFVTRNQQFCINLHLKYCRGLSQYESMQLASNPGLLISYATQKNELRHTPTNKLHHALISYATLKGYTTPQNDMIGSHTSHFSLNICSLCTLVTSFVPHFYE
jgi:hypothetical protein